MSLNIIIKQYDMCVPMAESQPTTTVKQQFHYEVTEFEGTRYCFLVFM